MKKIETAREGLTTYETYRDGKMTLMIGTPDDGSEKTCIIEHEDSEAPEISVGIATGEITIKPKRFLIHEEELGKTIEYLMEIQKFIEEARKEKLIK